MKAIRPKLGFRNKTVPEKIGICGKFIRAVAQVPTERREYVRVAALEEQLDEAETAVAHVAQLQAELRSALLHRNAVVARLCEKVALGVRCLPRESYAAAGVATTTFGVIGRAPRRPENFRVLRVMPGGLARLAWKREFRRSFFVVQMTTDCTNEASWQQFQLAHGARTTLTGLERGVIYYFRVAEQNGTGLSPWTQAISVVGL